MGQLIHKGFHGKTVVGVTNRTPPGYGHSRIRVGVTNADAGHLIGVSDSTFDGRDVFWRCQALDHQANPAQGVVEKLRCPGILDRKSVVEGKRRGKCTQSISETESV